tara:strand:- start:2428 stop:3468 length:1041 start_codon:yes stop_codon:yes gene_type:complete
MKFSSTNNFDLIRLFAATQVAITHSSLHFDYESIFIDLLEIFPGVPIFFFISGFLIFGSYEKSLQNDRPIINFYTKRFLRLYPALWVCILISVIMLFISGYFSITKLNLVDLIIWLFANSTFFQFYNPDFLRDFGVGVINGSLWTITVEIQFYILAPLLFFLFRKNLTYILILFFFLVLFNAINTQFNLRENIIEKLISVSFIPWLYMFILGALTYKFQRIVYYISKTPFVLLLAVYIFILYFTNGKLEAGNTINFIAYLSLISIVIKLAIYKPNLSDDLIKRNDISYGIYIYHMPVVNFVIYYGYKGGNALALTLVCTFLIALFSWFLIEKPSLKIKKNQLRKNY